MSNVVQTNMPSHLTFIHGLVDASLDGERANYIRRFTAAGERGFEFTRSTEFSSTQAKLLLSDLAADVHSYKQTMFLKGYML